MNHAILFCCALTVIGCKKNVISSSTTLPSLTASATLQSVAPFPVGTAVDPDPMQNNSLYTQIISKEFNSVTPESAMKFDKIQGQQNVFDFTGGDYIVDFAQHHQQRIHGHTLIWHHALPNWVINFSGDSLAWENIFKTYIKTVVTHYKGKVGSWDVVNEAIDDSDGTLVNQDKYGPGSGSVWCQHLGPDYIARAFQYAHEADPDALLFYNDYGNDNGGWNDTKLNALLALVTNMQKRGIAISGVGIQMHINLNTDNDNITATLKKIAATGLKIHISELDISVNPNHDPGVIYTDDLKTLQADKYQFIAQTYRAVVPAAQQFGITTWEFSDAYCESTLQNKEDWRLIYDMNYKKKPDYFGYIKGLAK